MADQGDSGERTEKPTDKRLRDARKKGDVHKSREVSTTAGLIAFLVVGTLMLGYAGARLSAVFELAIAAIDKPFALSSVEVGWDAAVTLVTLVLALAMPVALVALVAEYMQAGPVFTFEKIRPDMDRLNFVSGLKRMFSTDNFVELAKAIAKTLVLGTIAWVVLRDLIAHLPMLMYGAPGAFGEAMRVGAFRLLAWSLAIFAVISVADALYQRFSFLKKMRMSIRDIKQQYKEDEGDPYIKGRRKQLHKEWADRNSVEAARRANVLVVNPTHVAIAIDYDPETSPLPVVSAKGEDDLALDMREEAKRAGVPVLQNIPLARALLDQAEVEEVVPSDLFEAVAHAIVWARGERERQAKEAAEQARAATAARG